jgi:transposase
MKKRKISRSSRRELRQQRRFSEAFRRQRVLDIEQGLLTVSETRRIYAVSSSSIYRWLHMYSNTCKHKTRIVVEQESEEHRSKQLLARVAELERTVGQKQLHIEVLERLVDDATTNLGEDWKKNSCPHSRLLPWS